MRRVIAFPCKGATLVGTVDEAVGPTGVLVVSGGNEIRCGAHRGMAMLAQRLAAAGVPVFRFDRRGVGDSEGENGGYATSAPDIAAALTVFRHEQPQVARVIGLGNCDAATALLLLDRDCDALVLANPWLGDESAAPPPAAMRAHYLARLRSPATWPSLLSRGIVRRVADLASAFGTPREQPLAARIAVRLGSRPTTIVLATGDRTAMVFAGSVPPRAGVRVVRIDTASHSFAGRDDAFLQVLLDAVAASNDKAVS